MLDGAAVTSGEDVFPFRRSWASPSEVIYTADEKPSWQGVVTPFEFLGRDLVYAHAHKHATRDFDSRTPRPARGIMAPALSPDGTQVAFAALGDLWLMSIGS